MFTKYGEFSYFLLFPWRVWGPYWGCEENPRRRAVFIDHLVPLFWEYGVSFRKSIPRMQIATEAMFYTPIACITIDKQH